jgi:hypothetical protein
VGTRQFVSLYFGAAPFSPFLSPSSLLGRLAESLQPNFLQSENAVSMSFGSSRTPRWGRVSLFFSPAGIFIELIAGIGRW